jgi:hypothetical protein
MIRGGEEFGPYPVGIVIPTRITSDYVEFVSLKDEATQFRQVTRLEKEPDPAAGTGFFRLMYKRWEYSAGTQTSFVDYPLIRNLRAATFTLEYDRGPRLRRCTIDIMVKPDDDQAMAVASDLEPPVIRLIASASPRRLDE